MTQSGGSAEAESDILQSGEAWALWFPKSGSGSFSAPRIGPRVVLAMEKLKEARMRSDILQHLQRISLDTPNTGPKQRDACDGVCL